VCDSVEISEKITGLTGITRKTCSNYGRKIDDVLEEFLCDYKKCSRFVAHNIEFDKKMIIIEMERNTSSYLVFQNKDELYCTMLYGAEVCDIWVEYRRRRQKKWPTLSELHMKLHGYVPPGLHDALEDTKACLNCYLKLIE
jgi:DNA polymerase III epsilon subunit-like protein